MSLQNLSYTEYSGDPRHWRLDALDFGSANLVVGRNATGKSRVVSVITSLMAILAGTRARTVESGTFVATFSIDNTEYIYELEFKSHFIAYEKLMVDGMERLKRDAEGHGSIYYAKEGRFLDFEIGRDAIAIQARRDRLQHPYIVALSEWAAASATYNFGSDFGKSTLHVLAPKGSVMNEGAAPQLPDDPNDPVGTYVNGFSRFGEEFDKAIIADMSKLGYELNEVAAETLDSGIAISPHGAPFIALTVVEKDLPPRIPQLYLSQGMFRALALVIKLNWTVFSERRGLILIDDLGEGLDYERACAAVALTMERARASSCQVIVTTNDRFVMNTVPLEDWIVLRRTGALVKGFTARNSQQKFEEFRFTGLSNFDFFTSSDFP